jgi:hypothetical protein
MAVKAQAIKFTKINQATIRGKVGHTRTGACTSKGKCNHGMRPVIGKPHTR